MSYQTIFPSFDLDVEIPQGFQDVTRPHDQAPTWIDEERHMQLTIAEKAGTGSRFLLTRITEDLEFVKTLVETNKWQDIIFYLEQKKGLR